LIAAVTGQAVGNDLHVPVLPRDAETAAIRLAVDDEGPADPGAESHEHDVRLALHRAEAPLGPAAGVGVVLDDDGEPGASGDGLAKRLVAPRQVGSEQHGGT
jgi:hypothetical protein